LKVLRLQNKSLEIIKSLKKKQVLNALELDNNQENLEKQERH